MLNRLSLKAKIAWGFVIVVIITLIIGVVCWDGIKAGVNPTTALIIGMVLDALITFSLGIFLGTSVTRPIIMALEKLEDTAKPVALCVETLSSSSQRLAESNSEQASSIEETSSTLEECSSMIQQNNENTKQAAQLGAQTKASADRANEEMKNMMSSMNEIKKSSDQIAKIINVIDDIAFQTNILALNAAVEAARAGDAGMGFAVVAEEVRNLAQRSAQAAKDTAAMIEANIDLSEKGVHASQIVQGALSQIASETKKVTELMDEISAASQEQTQGISQINKAIAQMEKAIQQNASTAEEVAAASEEIKGLGLFRNKLMKKLDIMVIGSGSQDGLSAIEMTDSNVNSIQLRQNSSKEAANAVPLALKVCRSPKGRAKARMVVPNEVIPLDTDLDDF